MKTKLGIFNNDSFLRSEKVCTLKEYIEMDRMKPGQCILIGNINCYDQEETHDDTELFWVGDCTPFFNGRENDGGVGWINDPRLEKFVLEVNTYGEI